MTWNELFALIISIIVLPSAALILRLLLPLLFEYLRANIHNKDVALIADVAGRAAGRVALDAVVAKQADPNADIRAVIADGLQREAKDMAVNLVKSTAEKLGANVDTLEKMVAGELGKIIPPAAEPAPPVISGDHAGSRIS